MSAADVPDVQVDADPIPDSPAVTKRAQALLDEADSWAQQLTAVWIRLLRREKKVITEKLRGSKARQNTKFWDWGAEGPPEGFEFKALDVGKWMDKGRWLDELGEELSPVFERLYDSFLSRGQKIFDGEEKHLPGLHDQEDHGNDIGLLPSLPRSRPVPRPWQRNDYAVPSSGRRKATEYAEASFGLTSPVTATERKRLRQYQEFGYKRINGNLRSPGWEPNVLADPSRYDRTMTVGVAVKSIDAAIARSTVDEDVIVYRGIALGMARRILEAGNEDFADDGYASTSLLEDVALRFGNVAEIHVPAGSKALSLDVAGIRPKGGSKENEVLLPRGARFRVDEVEDLNGDGMGPFRFVLTYLGAEPEKVSYKAVPPSEEDTGALNPLERFSWDVGQIRFRRTEAKHLPGLHDQRTHGRIRIGRVRVPSVLNKPRPKIRRVGEVPSAFARHHEGPSDDPADHPGFVRYSWGWGVPPQRWIEIQREIEEDRYRPWVRSTQAFARRLAALFVREESASILPDIDFPEWVHRVRPAFAKGANTQDDWLVGLIETELRRIEAERGTGEDWAWVGVGDLDWILGRIFAALGPEGKHLPGRHDQDRHGGGGIAVLDRPWDRLQKLAVDHPDKYPSPRYWLTTDGMWVPVDWHEDAFPDTRYAQVGQPPRTVRVGQPGAYRAFANATNAVRVTVGASYSKEASINIFNPMTAAQIDALSTIRRPSVLIAPEGPDTGGKIRRVQDPDPESMRDALEWANGMLRGTVRHPSRLVEFKGVRRVRTPGGREQFDQPIGSIIKPDVDAHTASLADALHTWLDGPRTLRSHLAAEIAGDPHPDPSPTRHVEVRGEIDGEEVEWTEDAPSFLRTQAAALLRELELHGRTNPVPLYRGGGDDPFDLRGWSENRMTAERWAKLDNGKVHVLPAGAAFGIRIADYADLPGVGSEMEVREQEWIISRVKREAPVAPEEKAVPRPRARILREKRDLAKLTARRIAEAREYHEAWLDRLTALIDEVAARDSAIMQDVLDAIETQYGTAEGEVGSVATSQAIASVNDAQLEIVKRSGLKGKKVWFTAMDERVRPSHRKVHGQRRDLTKPFKVPHRATVTSPWKNVSMQYPGDRSGPVGEWINCRCVLLFYPAASGRAGAGEPEPALEAASRFAALQSSLSLDITNWLEEKADIRRVRTQAGVRRFNRPIGSPIFGADVTPEVDPGRHARLSTEVSESDPRFHLPDAMRDWVYSYDSAKRIRMAAGELTGAYDDVLSPQLYEEPDNFFEREAFEAYGPPPRDMLPDDDDIAEGVAWAYANAEAEASALLTALTTAPPHDGPLFRQVNVPLDMLPEFDAAVRKGHVDLPLEAVGDSARFVARFDRSSAPEDPEFVNPLRHDPEGEMQSSYYDAAAESPRGMPSWQGYLDEQDEERRQAEFHYPVLFRIEPGARALTGGTEYTENPRRGTSSWREYITGGRFEVVSDAVEEFNPWNNERDIDRRRVITLRQTHTYLPSGTLMKKGLLSRIMRVRTEKGRRRFNQAIGSIIKPDIDLTDPRPRSRPLASDAQIQALRNAYSYRDPDTSLSVSLLDFKVSNPSPDDPQARRIDILATIRDGDDLPQGTIQNSVWPDADPPTVLHGLIQVNDRWQGKGFGERFLRHEEDSYLEAGIKHIDLLAGMQVGGYAWARLGFDWRMGGPRSPWFDVKKTLYDFLMHHGDYNVAPDDVPLIQAALSSLIEAEAGRADPPTPNDIAMLGRNSVMPGQKWIGKVIMQRSQWEGRKTLVPVLASKAWWEDEGRARRLKDLADQYLAECEERGWDLGEDGVDWDRADEEREEKGIRRVRTPAGSRRYGAPIGSPIVADSDILAPLSTGPRVFYRLHPRGVPFGSEHAHSQPLNAPGGAERFDQPGYSTFANPAHLRQYLQDMEWDPADGIIVRFEGDRVGEGFDGEPLVVPTSGIQERISWRDFQDRIEATPEALEFPRWGEADHSVPSIPALDPGDYHALMDALAAPQAPGETRPRAVIFDRDGTLASVPKAPAPTVTVDGHTRRAGPGAWAEYNAALPFDRPVPRVAALLRAVPPNVSRIMVSGRAEGDWPGDRRRRFAMQDWIAKHELPVDDLFMRVGGDMRRDSIIKEELLINEILTGYDVRFAVDDRPEVLEVWRRHGIPTLQVHGPDLGFPIADRADRYKDLGRRDFEFKRKGPKKVRTRAGVEKFGQPIGSVITPDVPLGSKANPHRTSSAKQGARHLAAGDYVIMNRPKQAVALVEELRKIARKAEKEGKTAPTFDLCKVFVEDTNLFCVRSKGIPRVQMPQLTGIPISGSRADNLIRDAKGKVDLGPFFLEHLAKHGAVVHHEIELANRLLASQNELDGAKVGRMMRRMRKGEPVRELFVSDDNYIVDGHHHWAAQVGLSVEKGEALHLRVARVDLSITELLDLANSFAADWGIGPRAVDTKTLTLTGVLEGKLLRYVRTPEGRLRYDQPINTPIRPRLLPSIIPRPRPPRPASVRKPAPRISVVVPTNVGTIHSPGLGPRMSADLIADKMVADTVRRQAGMPGFEDLQGRTDREAFDVIINRMADNIVAAVDRSFAISPEATRQHASWYPFANKWLTGLVDEMNARPGPGRRFTPTAAFAATAALSPGADWANNVAWAKHLMETIRDEDKIEVDKKWVDAWLTAQVERWENSSEKNRAKKPKPTFPEGIVGKRLSQLDATQAAIAIRGRYNVEGLYQMNRAAGFGDTSYTANPNSNLFIAKAISVLRDPSLENIDEQLGEEHKVRSFYENIAHPFDADDLNVTADVHHYSIANGVPLSVTNPFMKSTNVSVHASPYNNESGIRGTYPLIVEATRQAAARINAKHGTTWFPNQVQSVAWEQMRAEFSKGFKKKHIVDAISEVQSAWARGEIDDETRRRRLEEVRVEKNAATVSEIAQWYEQDLANGPRMTLLQLRKMNAAAAKAAAETKALTLDFEDEPAEGPYLPEIDGDALYDAEDPRRPLSPATLAHLLDQTGLTRAAHEQLVAEMAPQWANRNPESVSDGGIPSEAKSLGELEEKRAIARVRTQEGVRRYGLPINSPIIGVDPARPVTRMMRRLVHQGGFTIHPTGTEPKKGYAVAVGGRSSITPADEFFSSRERAIEIVDAWLKKYADTFDDPAIHVGGWYDREHDEIVFDPSEVVDDLDAARKLGVNRNEQAVHDLERGVEIPSGGTGQREEHGLKGLEGYEGRQGTREAAARGQAAQEGVRDERRRAEGLRGWDRRPDARPDREGQEGLEKEEEADLEGKRATPRVRTPEGVRKYNLPLRAPIVARPGRRHQLLSLFNLNDKRGGFEKQLRIIANALGVDPYDVSVRSLSAHSDEHAKAPRSRLRTKSPCWASRRVDFTVHRWLPGILEEKYPRLAQKLLDTSPRWGRLSNPGGAVPLPEMKWFDLDDDFDDGLDDGFDFAASEVKAVRRVRTPEGARKYGQVIGSRILVDTSITGHGSSSGGGSFADPPASEAAIRKANVAKRDRYFADLLPDGAGFEGETDPAKIASRLSLGWRRAAASFESDDTTIANALRIAAVNALDVPAGTHAGERVESAKKLYAKNKATLDAFAKAQYRTTQEHLETEGVKAIAGFRGASYDDEDPDWADFPDWAKPADGKDSWVEVTPPESPLTSHSTSLKEAAKFADATGGKSVILRSVIPATEVFALYRTGLGMYGEDEVVTRGKVETTEARVYDPRDLDDIFDEERGEEVGRRFLGDGEEKAVRKFAAPTEEKATDIIRRVRSPEGVRHYDQPLGSIIIPDVLPIGPIPIIPGAISRQVTFDADRLPRFEEAVAKVNKAAARMKVGPLTFAELSRGTRKDTSWDNLYAADTDAEVETVTIAITGESPRLPGGWTYLGTIEYLRGGPGEEDGRLVHGDDPRLAQFRTSAADCEYCNLPRDRKKVMVLENDDGKLVRVGSSCLKDFLGYHGNPERVAWLSEQFRSVVDDLEDEESAYKTDPWEIPTNTFLELSAAVVREFGWVPKSSQYGLPTAQRIQDILHPPSQIDRAYKDELARVEITDADVERAKVVREWAAVQDYSNNYLGNLRTVLGGPIVGGNRYGIAASAVGAWERATGIEEERKRKREAAKLVRASSDWVGEIGKRQDFTATVTAKIRYESEYGGGYVMKFVDEVGNVLKSFTSGSWTYQTDVGDRVTFKATVKGHDTYQDAKETNLTRVGQVKPVDGEKADSWAVEWGLIDDLEAT